MVNFAGATDTLVDSWLSRSLRFRAFSFFNRNFPVAGSQAPIFPMGVGKAKIRDGRQTGSAQRLTIASLLSGPHGGKKARLGGIFGRRGGWGTIVLLLPLAISNGDGALVGIVRRPMKPTRSGLPRKKYS